MRRDNLFRGSDSDKRLQHAAEDAGEAQALVGCYQTYARFVRVGHGLVVNRRIQVGEVAATKATDFVDV